MVKCTSHHVFFSAEECSLTKMMVKSRHNTPKSLGNVILYALWQDCFVFSLQMLCIESFFE